MGRPSPRRLCLQTMWLHLDQASSRVCGQVPYAMAHFEMEEQPQCDTSTGLWNGTGNKIQKQTGDLLLSSSDRLDATLQQKLTELGIAPPTSKMSCGTTCLNFRPRSRSWWKESHGRSLPQSQRRMWPSSSSNKSPPYETFHTANRPYRPRLILLDK